uniref:Uncharacterized protein n=1 Tax=Panagrolaimus superbus TaxID=310955 RepID=A0A914ZBH4_9BILA
MNFIDFKAQTSVTKNIERQRLRRHGETQNYYNQEGSLTLSKTPEDRHHGDLPYSPRRRFESDFERMGRMRRIKSESALGGEESDEENYGTSNRRLKRFGEHEHSDYATPPPTSYHGSGHNNNLMFNTKMSQSIHDLSMAHMTSPTLSEAMPRRSAEAPGKFYTGNANGMLYNGQNNNAESATMNRILRRTVSPAYSNSSSQFDNGGLPGYPSSQIPPPHGGFSYLFPTLPIVDRIVGRSKTPEVYAENHAISPQENNILPPRIESSNSNNYDYQSVASPRSHPIHISQGSDPSTNVVYIPINMIEKKPVMLSPRSIQVSSNHKFSDHHRTANLSPNQSTNEPPFNQKYDKRRQTDNGLFETENLQNDNIKQENNIIKRTPHYSGSTNLGEDVRDALREFDYLNDYDESSVRNDTIPHNPTAIYHF